jgi:cytochrome c biogenesis protein ResB
MASSEKERKHDDRTPATGPLHRIGRTLRSLEFAAVLMALLAGACMLGVLVPQQGSASYPMWKAEHPTLARMADTTNIDRMFTSVPFFVLIALATVSASVSVGWRLRGLRPDRTLSVQRRLAGSLLFHAGLLGIVVAAFTSAITHTEGTLILTEGQTLSVHDAFSAPEAKPMPTSTMQIRLDEFHPVHEGPWGMPDYASDVTLIEEGGEVRSATVRVNEPLVYGNMSFYQQSHGFSPQFEFRDIEGRYLFTSWVSLDSDRSADPVRYRDDFAVPGTDLTVEAELFPDVYMVGNKLASRSPDPKSPVLAVTVRRGVDTLYEGPLYLGRQIDLGADMRLGFSGLRYWSALDVVRDCGARAVFVCAWIAVAGLCIRFMPRLHNGDREV